MHAPASFGSWLKLQRWTLDLTQDALARQVGCSAVTIRKLEADERRASRQLAERLADVLRIAPFERPAFVGLARAEASPPSSAPAADLPAGPVPHQRPANLPLPLTRLIGRRAEVAAVRRALLRGATRLVTLTGPPGVGKTRLALEVAGALRSAFADGVCFVDLAPIHDPDLVLGAIGRALGVRELGEQPFLERVQAVVQGKRLLFVLDNFEHVVAAAPLVVELLVGGAGLKALITSRTPLQVRGEQRITVLPLPVPDRSALPPLRTLAQNPAMALFLERAHAAQPSFALTAANAATIAALCERLDGLPLALELVAVRVNTLPLDDLLAGLDRRLALLSSGPRDLPPRHQTLRTAIEGSYALLEAPAQALFRWLSVFAGGASLDAIAALCRVPTAGAQDCGERFPILDRHALLAALATLTMHSLVERHAPADDPPRWAMLETIRAFAGERLLRSGEASGVQHAHAAYFLAMAEQAEGELHGPDQVAWLDRLETDVPNLRVALDWLLATGDRDGALRLAGALWWFWSVRGYRSEGRRWLERALDGAVLTADRDANDGGPREAQAMDRAQALYAAGHLAMLEGDFVGARDRLSGSAAVWRELVASRSAEPTARQGLSDALAFLILTLQFQGDTAAREPLMAEFFALSETLTDPRSRATLLHNLGGWALLQHGDYTAARPLLEQSLALLRPLGDLWHIARVVIDLGLVALYDEDYAAAQSWYSEGLALARTLGDREMIAAALNNLGEVARCRDDSARAAELYGESLRLHHALGNQPETPRLRHNLGYVSLREDHLPQAAGYFRASLAGFQQLGMARGIAEALAGFAAVAARNGRPRDAAQLWGAAEALRTTVKTPVWPTDRREHARYQALVRAELDDETFAAAWATGHAMTLEQAIAAALDERVDVKVSPDVGSAGEGDQ